MLSSALWFLRTHILIYVFFPPACTDSSLGASGDDVDDLAAWASRVKPKTAAEGDVEAGSSRPSKRAKRSGGTAAAAAEGSDEDGEGGHTAADLQGVKVRHDVETLVEGETVVLTLADTGGWDGGP